MATVFSTLSRWAFVSLVAMLFVVLVAYLLGSTTRPWPEIGCYWQKGFLVCRGFAGGELLSSFVNVSLFVLIMAPSSLLAHVQNPSFIAHSTSQMTLSFTMIASSLWLFIGLAWPIRWAIQRISKVRRS